MSHAALTAKYRPQTFAQVAGQETLKAILSRASLEGRVAPAYLFSGTRGVGKTTLARIFAKALNCRTAPTAEPCNVCDQCRAVTNGSAVDVVEIDGASNRGIDDVRRLKEVVGYAPMEGGYKIFIIDEAHMLSREAFNALLKTLEEPPARVTFIMATTEPHKFPATIISRCQHYVFKRLPENGLVDHLCSVLSREQVDFDETAVRLIARRGAGSVRDSMSLLGQVLALGAGKLTEDSTRSVLGLAGQEAFMNMVTSFQTGDSLTLTRILRDMLDQGLDMGFFLRELASMWRNLFLLRQSGEAALAVVELPEAEARAFLEASKGFSLQHIHACWQMTLEGQRRVLTSLEPALALELLLLNLAMLPQLLSLENLSALGRKGTPAQGTGQGTPQGPGRGPGQNSGQGMSQGGGPGGSLPPKNFGNPAGTSGSPQSGTGGDTHSPRPLSGAGQQADTAPTTLAPVAVRENPASAPAAPRPIPQAARPGPAKAPSDIPPPWDEDEDGSAGLNEADVQAALSQSQFFDAPPSEQGAVPVAGASPAIPSVAVSSVSAFGSEEASPDVKEYSQNPVSPAAEANLPSAVSAGVPSDSPPKRNKPGWQSILSLCAEQKLPPWMAPLLRRVTASWNEDRLILVPQDAFTAERLEDAATRPLLESLLTSWCGFVPACEILAPVSIRKSRGELQEEVMQHPLVKEIQEHFGARIVDYGQIH